MNHIASHIFHLNQKYFGPEVNFLQERSTYVPNFKVIEHPSCVLLSAPHAVKQYRNGAYKGADLYTGAIVEYLCETAHCNGIIRTFNDKDDPNFYSDGISGIYKNAILDLIQQQHVQILLDIHGCSDHHACDLFIGTNHGKNLCAQPEALMILEELLSLHGITFGVDQGNFCATGLNNISRQTAQKRKIPCMQLEISKKYRTEPEHLPQLLSALQDYVAEMEKRTGSGNHL